MSFLLRHRLRKALTITSPVLYEVVLQLRVHPSIPSRSDLGLPPWSDPERWHPGMDDVFGEQFAERKDFRFIIKTHESLEQETIQRQMKETFSLLAGKGCVHFETVDSIQNLF